MTEILSQNYVFSCLLTWVSKRMNMKEVEGEVIEDVVLAGRETVLK